MWIHEVIDAVVLLQLIGVMAFVLFAVWGWALDKAISVCRFSGAFTAWLFTEDGLKHLRGRKREGK